MGEDLGGGSPDVQAPRTFESRTGSKKISGRFEEDLDGLIPHAVPGWAADCGRLRLGTAALVY